MNDPYKHWLIECAETGELGSYSHDGGLERTLDQMFIGACRGLSEGKVWGEPTVEQFQVLTRAHEDAEQIVHARRDAANTARHARLLIQGDLKERASA